MSQITPCLCFDGRAEEAMTFYAGIFPDTEVLSSFRASNGLVVAMTVRLLGQDIMALNGPAAAFTPAMSLFVRCDNQAEVDRYWDQLVEGGKPMRCGWLSDRYGVCWQIVPSAMLSLLQGPDPVRSGRAFQAMLGMVRLDIAALQAAYDA